jgi:hypothetical protein
MIGNLAISWLFSVINFHSNFVQSDVEVDFPEFKTKNIDSIVTKQPESNSNTNENDSVLELKLPKNYSQNICSQNLPNCQIL